MHIYSGRNRISVSIRLEIIIKTASKNLSLIKYSSKTFFFIFCEFCPLSIINHLPSSFQKSIMSSQSGSSSKVTLALFKAFPHEKYG